MQSSALNFSVCVDDSLRIENVLEELDEHYGVLYNSGLELVTIRHYDEAAIQEVVGDREIVDSQVSRKTARYVIKASEWNFS